MGVHDLKRIRSHVLVCFMALILDRVMRMSLKLPICQSRQRPCSNNSNVLTSSRYRPAMAMRLPISPR